MIDFPGKPNSNTSHKATPPLTKEVQQVPPGNTATPSTSSLKEAGFKTGDSALATVLENVVIGKAKSHEAALQRIMLQVNNAKMEVLTNIPLKQGDVIGVKVLDDLKLAIRQLPQTTLPSTQKLASLIARILPYQAKLDLALTSAMNANKQSDQATTTSGPQKIELSNLLKNLPNLEKLNQSIVAIADKISSHPINQGIIDKLVANQQVAVKTDSPNRSSTHIQIKPLQLAVTELVKSAISNTVKQNPGYPKEVVNAAIALTKQPTQTLAEKLLPQLAKQMVFESDASATPRPQTTNNQANLTPLAEKQVLPTAVIKQALNTQKTLGGVIQTIQNLTSQIQPTLLKEQGIPKDSAGGSKTSDANLTPGTLKSSALNPKNSLTDLLTTATFKTLLNQTGINLESSLRTNTETFGSLNLQNDLKASLVKLTTMLSPEYLKENGILTQQGKIPTTSSPELLDKPFEFPKFNSTPTPSAATPPSTELSAGELLKQIAAALNRIQFNQLNSLYQSQTTSTDTTNVQNWMVDLPIVFNEKVENIQVKIEQHQEKQRQQKKTELERQWKVTLGFDFDELGPMQIQVRWITGKVSSILWAERTSTLRKLNEERDYFREQLANLGLEVESIECRHGKLKQQHEVITQNLVDVRT